MTARTSTKSDSKACSGGRRSPLFVTVALFLPCLALAQWDLPVPLVLNGEAAADKQLVGLNPPLIEEAAISAAAVRSSAVGQTLLIGTASILGSLTPQIDAYHTGMLITGIPTEVNQAAATLDLNGLGPRFIVKNGSQVLDSADLRPGIPVRLLYDGERFQLLNRTYLTCPRGFSAVNHSYCIADQPLPTSTFFDAVAACSAHNARLCSINEWAYACRSMPGFLATVITAEWVDDAANNTDGAKLLGAGNDGEQDVPGTSCIFGSQGAPLTLNRTRCCLNR